MRGLHSCPTWSRTPSAYWEIRVVLPGIPCRRVVRNTEMKSSEGLTPRFVKSQLGKLIAVDPGNTFHLSMPQCFSQSVEIVIVFTLSIVIKIKYMRSLEQHAYKVLKRCSLLLA